MEYIRLSECASFRNERTNQIETETYISTENMLPNKGGITTVESIPDVKTTTRYCQNDILLSNIRPYFKKIWLSDRIGGCSNDVLVITAKQGWNPRFLYYVLSDNNFFNYDTVTSKGTKMPRGTPKAIMKYLVPNISIAHQDRIVSMLSKFDLLIGNNNKRIKILEQMAENLYKEWFVRFRFPGHETDEFENGIPKGWEYKTVESLSSVLQRGISPTYDDDGELTVISQKCIRQNIMDIKESRKHTKTFKPELNLLDGDTVICSTGTGTLGRVGQVYGEYPNTTFDSHVTLVRAKTPLGKHFLFWSLKAAQIWFMNMGIGSTNQQELYRSVIKNMKVLRPTNEFIDKFEKIIEPIHKNIILLVNRNDNLIKQRDLLLPRLMSGKLEV